MSLSNLRDQDGFTSREREIVECLKAADRPMTLSGISEASGVARRTVYSILQRFLSEDLVVRGPSLRDARQYFYRWVGP